MILINFAKILQICLREDDFLVDFEKCCKMRIWTRKSASIQRRTSLVKSDGVVAAEQVGGVHGAHLQRDEELDHGAGRLRGKIRCSKIRIWVAKMIKL